MYYFLNAKKSYFFISNVSSYIFIRKKIKHYMVCVGGCPCHLVSLAVRKVVTCLPENIDEHLINLMHYYKEKRILRLVGSCTRNVSML